ncbi:MAG: hypothetical protein K8H87_13405 [Pseudorhodoplanes sp.]|nr:hypothetical protein [Pseudorhodoplanes sp.]
MPWITRLWISASQFRVSCFLVAAGSAIGPFVVLDSALAATRREPCDAVHRIAEIEYDSRLLVNLAANRANNSCVFFVSLPPSSVADNPQARAAAEFQSLYKSKPDFATAGAAVFKIAPEFINALLMPLTDARFQTPDAFALTQAVKERTKLIEECSLQSLRANMQFQKKDAIISCGITARSSSFVITASLRDLTLSVLIPLV